MMMRCSVKIGRSSVAGSGKEAIGWSEDQAERMGIAMPYKNADEVFELAKMMQARGDGVSLADIQEAFACGPRKAQRLRAKVRDMFFGVQKVDLPERALRYRLKAIKGKDLDGLINVGPEELLNHLAKLKTITEFAKRIHLTDHVKTLEWIENRLRALLDTTTQVRMEPDLEWLTQAEGLAMRPGPKIKIDSKIVEPLRKAILNSRVVKIRYRAHRTGKFSWNRLHPYGFLYGNQHFLVAWSLEVEAWRLFRLTRIFEVVFLDESFVPDSEFSLKAYSEQSFGVFQEEPFDVVWKFAPEVAEDAREYQFHPSQQEPETLPDGSLIVRFRAGGAQEMKWHLYTWGDKVEVLEPEWLRGSQQHDRRA